MWETSQHLPNIYHKNLIVLQNYMLAYVFTRESNGAQQQSEACSTCKGMLTQLTLHAFSNRNVQLHFSSHLGQTRSRAAV